jgi:site-specific recombinase XerD
MRAPICPFQTVSALHSVITARMKQAGIVPQGRHGTHAFRFARAHSVLQASVSLKSISDLLGHLRTASTESYLRLATDNLRAVSLDIPGGPISARSEL